MIDEAVKDGVKSDKCSLGHLFEQVASVAEAAGARQCGDNGGVGVGVFGGKVGEELVGGVGGAGLGVEVDEAVGEERVEGEGALDEVGVEEGAELEVSGGDAFGEEGCELVSGIGSRGHQNLRVT